MAAATSVPSPAPITRQRLWRLDVLRALACLLVIGNHYEHVSPRVPGWIAPVFRQWKFSGWVGVDLFFVLSGFLVSGLLLREYRECRRVRVGRFFVRRALKIYPAFYVFLLLSVGAFAVIGEPREPLRILSEVLFVQNYLDPVWGHTWSLAVEEHFYIAIGLVVWWLARRPGRDPFRHLPLAFVALATVALASRVATATAWSYSHRTHAFPSHLRFDSLLAGVCLAYYYHFHSERFHRWVDRRRTAIVVVSALCLLPLLRLRPVEPLMHTIGFSTTWLGFAGVVTLAVGGRSRRHASAAPAGLARALSFVGEHSYSIYLYHYPLSVLVRFRLAERFDLDDPAVWAFVYLAYGLASIVGGIVMAKAVELPVLRLRDRWFPSRASALVGGTVTSDRAGPAVVEDVSR